VNSVRDSRGAAVQELELKEGIEMRRTTVMILLALGIVAPVAVSAHEDGYDNGLLARFEGGIGVQPVTNVAGPVNQDGTFPNVRLNTVRGVSPGAPWRIAELRADVRTDGRIRVRGRGLLLASGNNIGRNGNASVFATLICEAAAPFIEHSTLISVPLEENGDFRIDSTLNTVPLDCPSPLLLIRNTGGVWFAAGIPRVASDD
jgi:hypothetical protein